MIRALILALLISTPALAQVPTPTMCVDLDIVLKNFEKIGRRVTGLVDVPGTKSQLLATEIDGWIHINPVLVDGDSKCVVDIRGPVGPALPLVPPDQPEAAS